MSGRLCSKISADFLHSTLKSFQVRSIHVCLLMQAWLKKDAPVQPSPSQQSVLPAAPTVHHNQQPGINMEKEKYCKGFLIGGVYCIYCVWSTCLTQLIKICAEF
ncbi:hypothetical protein AMECASPLE_033360 [Ameca splendens]|uniref:Uncharacterized protein n=1 Tax=Ameca splendens TaxID=208324 RepID=A0ABV0ZFM2_9TELE